jgi:hypothetical protein
MTVNTAKPPDMMQLSETENVPEESRGILLVVKRLYRVG